MNLIFSRKRREHIMEIEFLKAVKIGNKIYDIGERLEIKEPQDTLMDLNEDFYILIYHGLRYDVYRNAIKIIRN